jgi:hypothetical protein
MTDREDRAILAIISVGAFASLIILGLLIYGTVQLIRWLTR